MIGKRFIGTCPPKDGAQPAKRSRPWPGREPGCARKTASDKVSLALQVCACRDADCRGRAALLTRDEACRDCQLAAAAQLYADHQATNNGCAMVHSTNEERQGFLATAGYPSHAGATSNTGENLAWTSAIAWSNGVRETQINNGREVSGMWASEKEWYHMGASGDTCTIDTTVPGQNGMVGHYTAQIWHATTHVGCGVSQCNDHSVLWVCQYWPAGK